MEYAPNRLVKVAKSFAIFAIFILRYFDISAIYNRMKTLILSTAAAKDLDKLDSKSREQVSEALIDYAMKGVGDVKALQGRNGFRLRVGRYRVIFDEDQNTILAIYIGKRETTTYSRN